MASRRIVYGAALLAALAFQIFYDGYLAQYLLVCVIALPILSLLLSLPGVFRLRLGLAPSAPRLIAGTEGQWQVSVENPIPFPIARLTLLLAFQNSLTGAAAQERFRVTGLSGGQSRAFPLDSSHCGVLTCRVHRARALDFLGLFAFPLPTPKPAQAVVLPAPAPLEELPELGQVLSHTGLAPGRGRELEDYELRDYRPGDAIRSIHWKLSSKYDELVVRERLKSSHPQIILSFGLYGSPERLDRVLARLWSASTCLTSRGFPHALRWMDADGQLREESISSQAQLSSCVIRMLSRRAPLDKPYSAKAHPEQPGVFLFSITAGEEEAS